MIDQEVLAFLKRHKLYAPDVDMEMELHKLLDEMDAVYRHPSLETGLYEDGRQDGTDGASGKRTDASPDAGRSMTFLPGRVKMIPTYIGSFQPPAVPAAVTVLDIGGTNVRCASISVDQEGKCSVENRISFLTPGVSEETDTAGFFENIAWHVRDYLDAEHIGICFSLATIPQKDRDAVMAAGGKQIRIRDMIGKKVGESFRQALRKLGLAAGQKITVINDTVAAALAGQSNGHETDERTGKCRSGYIGFIYGTGTNLCYREPAGEWINVESGAYCGFPAGDIDDRYNSRMIDPMEDRFEKMVSGGYQGGLMEEILRSGAEEGILSTKTVSEIFKAARISSADSVRDSCLTSADISSFSGDPEGNNLIARSCRSETDRRRIAQIFDAVTDRSACFCSITITAAILRSIGAAGAEEHKKKPGTFAPGYTFITVEGSTYLKQHRFREMLDGYMDTLAGDKLGLGWEFHCLPDVILKGTAISCLSVGGNQGTVL